MTTEAGKRLHDARHLPDYCSDPCELREEVAAIEAEARIEHDHEVTRLREALSLAEEVAVMREAEARAAERARLRERVEGLRLDTDTGLTTQDPAVVWDNAIDAVLAILEDE